MTPRQLFGVAVRAAGLYVTYSGIVSLVGLAMAGMSPTFRFMPSGTTASVPGMLGGPLVGLVLVSLLQLVVGLWLLRGAPHLVRYAYREDEVGHRVAGAAAAHEVRA